MAELSRQPTEHQSLLSVSTYMEDECAKAIMVNLPPLHLRLAYTVAVWSFKAYFAIMLRTTRFVQRRPAGLLKAEVRSYPVRPDLRNRIFRPPNSEGVRLPLYLDIHGGGWVVADPETDDDFCSYLAQHANAMVVSIDYHKSPRYKFPYAVEDVTAIIDAVLNDETLNIDRTQVVLGGFSAGGNLAFAASQMDILRGRIHGLVGLYPVLNLTETLEEKLERRPKTGVSDILASSAGFLDFSYVPSGEDRRNPLLSPAFIQAKNLPRNVYLIGAEHDILCHEAREMAERLGAHHASHYGKSNINGVEPEDGWQQAGVRWEIARGKQHAFTHIPQYGKKEKERADFCSQMYSRIASWLVEEVWSSH